MQREETAVLVVGGSLVGLSAAMFLAKQRVPTVLVEQHLGSSPHPRAMGYTPRTLELFRALGLDLPQAPAGFRLRRVRVERLAGRWFDEVPWTPSRERGPEMEVSPSRGAAIAQDRLEPLLRHKALSLGADLRLGTTLERFEQDAHGVTAWLRRHDGHESTVRAAYLIAADGARSPIREALGITRSGRGHIHTVRSVLFRAPLEQYLESGISQFEIDQPELRAFLTTYGDGRWLLMFKDDLERDAPAQLRCVRQAIGRDDVPIELITTGRWELGALVADRFCAGRSFLAGDAAHALPPTRGGFGANTGIHDVHNLAWKLAHVLSGQSTPALLETYEAERRPVAWGRLLQTFARPDYAAVAQGIAEGVAILDETAIEFGELYRSSAVLGAGPELPAAARPEVWAGQPGTRAPHVWVHRGTERCSTLDLFAPGWTLVTADARWAAAAQVAKGALELRVVQLGVDVLPEASVAVAFGLSASGAALVRPDGYIAWRALDVPGDAARVLGVALAQVASTR
jgi:putative polyketide hydroxylase